MYMCEMCVGRFSFYHRVVSKTVCVAKTSLLDQIRPQLFCAPRVRGTCTASACETRREGEGVRATRSAMAPKPARPKLAGAEKAGATAKATASKGAKTTPRSNAATSKMPTSGQSKVKATPEQSPKIGGSPETAPPATDDTAKTIEELQERLAAAEARAADAEARAELAEKSASGEGLAPTDGGDSAAQLAAAEEKIRRLEREAELMLQAQDALKATIASLKGQLAEGAATSGAAVAVDVSEVAATPPPAAAPAPVAALASTDAPVTTSEAPVAAAEAPTLSADVPYRVLIELDPEAETTESLQVRVQLDADAPLKGRTSGGASSAADETGVSDVRSRSAMQLQRITRGRQSRKRMVGTRIEGGGGLATPRSTPDGADGALIAAQPPGFALGAPPVPAA